MTRILLELRLPAAPSSLFEPCPESSELPTMLPSIKDQLDPIFRPRSVAVVGASNRQDRWGYETMYNVLNWSQFRGEVYPINPKDEFVHGLKAYKSVIEVPGPIDLAVIVVNASQVRGRLSAVCGEEGGRRGHHHRRLRRGGDRGGQASGGVGAALPGERHPLRGPELQRPVDLGRPTESQLLEPGEARPDRLHIAERNHGRLHVRSRGGPRDTDSPRS